MRPDQAYVSITRTVTMTTIAEIADRIPELVGWLVARGAAPAGAPFLKYNAVDMDGELEVEAGVPVATPVPGDREVAAAVLPGGRYAVLTHVGHPDGLAERTAELLAWAGREGLAWDAAGGRWAARLEEYHTNPAEQPDPALWTTGIAIKLA